MKARELVKTRELTRVNHLSRVLPESVSAEDRRALIRQLLLSQVVQTQDALVVLLKKQGHHVTQATLSRDLAALGARRVHLEGGGTAYELAERPVAPLSLPLLDVRTLVRSIQSNGAMVVVHTTPGAAAAVALMIDSAGVQWVLGTVAGDDTIFVAPRQARDAAKLARALAEPLGLAT